MGTKIFLSQNDDRFNTDGLLQFGQDVVTLARRSVTPDDSDDYVAQLAATVRGIFVLSYHPHRDYIALAGDPLICSVVLGAALLFARQHHFDHVRVLKWDRLERAYYSVTIRLSHIGGIDDAESNSETFEA